MSEPLPDRTTSGSWGGRDGGKEGNVKSVTERGEKDREKGRDGGTGWSGESEAERVGKKGSGASCGGQPLTVRHFLASWEMATRKLERGLLGDDGPAAIPGPT